MTVQEGDFVKISYTGLVDDEVFDTTDDEKAKENGIYSPQKSYGPIVVRAGSMHVIAGLDEAIIGKEVGFEGEIEIPPEKAYGPRDDTLVRSAPVKDFPEKPTVGTRVSSEGREGVVVNVVGKRAVVDFNHPLAGKTLQYTFTIEDSIEDAVERAKALINLFSGRDMEVELAGGVLTVLLPPGITYDRRWLMGRGMAVHQIFEYLDGVDEVILKEVFTRPAQAEEAAEPVEEATDEPEEVPEPTITEEPGE
ncbi:MAG: peptidylprolyl isomerase [Methanomicrobiaceae archaeon]|nr:peptidylprolyl isomerase [Methanomicrobiaceae archaeon]